LEVALELSGIAIRRLRGTDVGSVKGDLLATFKDEFDFIQREERCFMTRADRLKEQASKQGAVEHPKVKQRTASAKEKTVQEEQLGKKSEAEAASAKPLEKPVLPDVGKDVQGDSDSKPMRDFEEEEIAQMKFEITKKEEQEQLKWDAWQKEHDRNEDQKLHDLAVKVLSRVRAAPEKDKAEIIETTLKEPEPKRGKKKKC
jgi:hypothetical protein